MALATLLVRIGADLTDLNKATDQMDRDLQKLGRKLTSLGGDLTAGLTVPITAAAAGLAAAALNVGGFADELLDLVDQTGLSAAALQEFRHVALVAGVDSDTLANAAIKLTTSLSGSGEESKQVSDALAKMGLSSRDATGALIPMDQLLPSIITGLQGTEDVTTRNALAGDIFGRSWAELAPILSLGAGEMEAAREQARALGLVMSGESLEAADQFRAQVDTLKSSMGSIVREIGMAVLPIMMELAELMQKTLVPAARSVIKWFDDLSPTTKTVIGVVAGLAAALGPLLIAIGSLLKLLPLLKVGLAALSGPVGAVILALGALTAAGIAVVDNWNVISFEAKRIWEAIRLSIKTVLDGVTTRFTALKTDVVRIVTELYNGVRDWLVTRFTAIVDGIKAQIDRIVGFFKGMKDVLVGNSIVVDMVNDIGSEFGRMNTAMSAESLAAVDHVTGSFRGLTGSLTGILGPELGGVLNGFGLFKNDLGTKVDDIVGSLRQKWGQISDILTAPETLSRLKTDWVTFFSDLASALSSFWNAIKGIADKVGSFFLSLGGGAQGFGAGGLNINLGTPGAPVGGISGVLQLPDAERGWLQVTAAQSTMTNVLLAQIVGLLSSSGGSSPWSPPPPPPAGPAAGGLRATDEGLGEIEARARRLLGDE